MALPHTAQITLHTPYDQQSRATAYAVTLNALDSDLHPELHSLRIGDDTSARVTLFFDDLAAWQVFQNTIANLQFITKENS